MCVTILSHNGPGKSMAGVAVTEEQGSLRTTALRAVDAAAVAELAWVVDGSVGAVPVVPLRLGDRVAVAMPYALADRLRPVGVASAVALVLSDPRLAGAAWRPIVLRGRPELVDDVTGEVFENDLLDQELRKHPPSRAYADSLLLRHENWWYLPRLMVTFEPVDIVPVEARTSARRQGVLALAGAGDRLDVRTVEVDNWTQRPLTLRAAYGEGTAALLTHDFSEPDLERWAAHLLTGRLTGDSLRVTHGPLGPPPPLKGLGLRERIRRHRDLERGCRRGIRTAERAAGI